MPSKSLFPLLARLTGRKPGIVAQLLGYALLSVVIAIAGVVGWTLWNVQGAQIESAQASLTTNFAILEDALRPMGTEWRLRDGKLTLNGQPIEGRDDIVDKVRRLASGNATIFADDTRVLTNVMAANGTRATGTKLAAGPVRDAVIGRGEAYRGEAVILGVPHLTIYQPLRNPEGQRVGILYVGVPLTGVEATVSRILHGSLLGGAVLLLAVGSLLLLVMRRALRPLGGLAKAVRSIADGNLDQPAPCTDRRDQLGEIGRAIEVLRGNSQRARDLETKARDEHAVRARRQEAMDRLTQDFGAAVSGVLSKLSRSADAMRGTAEQMAGSAQRTKTDMTVTVQDAELSAQNLGTVAAATEELTASVSEISRQVEHAAQSAGSAVNRAEETDRRVQGLSEAASQIGDVVRLISDIAGQTNLLALNATIEAARAGEAGKGFAVVAGEVKALAAQTAEATSRISAQIKAIQGATSEAVGAMRGVADAISQVSEAANTIATAVEEQGSATREIAAQVQTVTQATGTATRAMRDASHAADGAEATSREVLEAADGVAAVSAALREEVDQFLHAMRQSQEQGERRRYERIPGQGARAELKCSTHGQARVVITDISLGGASLACDWPCEIGAELLVNLPGAGGPAHARVVNSRGHVLGLAFRQDPATLARVGVAMNALDVEPARTKQTRTA
ncbi:methyl-accepting chemotaxis protein [Roseomonas sp. GCM10028921]